MINKWNWRWWLRLQCCMIVDFEHVVLPEKHDVYNIRLCKRSRFHRGECRG